MPAAVAKRHARSRLSSTSHTRNTPTFSHAPPAPPARHRVACPFRRRARRSAVTAAGGCGRSSRPPPPCQQALAGRRRGRRSWLCWGRHSGCQRNPAPLAARLPRRPIAPKAGPCSRGGPTPPRPQPPHPAADALPRPLPLRVGRLRLIARAGGGAAGARRPPKRRHISRRRAGNRSISYQFNKHRSCLQGHSRPDLSDQPLSPWAA
jgi:hypothetical protein